MLRWRDPPVTIIRELRDEEPFSAADVKGGHKFLYLLSAGPFIKIGISNNVESRAANIRTGFPYRVDILVVELRLA